MPMNTDETTFSMMVMESADMVSQVVMKDSVASIGRQMVQTQIKTFI